MSEWQSKETIPTDGRTVLIARWHEGWVARGGEGSGWSIVTERAVPKEYGWDYQVEAWMPLPTPPETHRDIKYPRRRSA